MTEMRGQKRGCCKFCNSPLQLHTKFPTGLQKPKPRREILFGDGGQCRVRHPSPKSFSRGRGDTPAGLNPKGLSQNLQQPFFCTLGNQTRLRENANASHTLPRYSPCAWRTFLYARKLNPASRECLRLKTCPRYSPCAVRTVGRTVGRT